ncbi:MAG TPA: GNAT family N-acetyltransferase, partial [Ktedonobacteraceae bacterium]
MSSERASPLYRQDLGDGLVLRWATEKDTDHVAHLFGNLWSSAEHEPPNPRPMDQIQRHMRGDFPLTTPDNCALVENTRDPAHPIVSCAFLWHLQWAYEGIPFSVGQPEMVATDAAFRHRGLVRHVFELLHARSAAQGHLVQAITGIYFFYRQFGYEYALDLGGKRSIYTALIPPAKQTDPEPYRLREATRADIPSIMQLYNLRQATSLVWTLIPQSYWEYVIDQWSHPSTQGKDATLLGINDRIFMLIGEDGSTLGYIIIATKRWGSDLSIYAFEAVPEVNLRALILPLLRLLDAYGKNIPFVRPDPEPLREISFCLGRSHPLYTALGQTLTPHQEPPYAWYIRVPDIAAFIRHIAPALEQRVSASVVAGYAGELKLSFYSSGLRLVFNQGRLISLEAWDPPADESLPDAGCPALIFIQLIFGYRSLDDLRAI